MKTILAFTMTPTEPMITILAGTLIIAGVALLVIFHLLHEARHEREQAIKNAMTWTEEAAKLQAENNLFAAKLSTYDADRVHQWATSKALTQAQEDNKQWKATYYEQLNRANRFETLYTRMTKRPRDPKTGRIVSAKAKQIGTATPRPHTLRHGMTVKAPTTEQADKIFDEAKRLGLISENSYNKLSESLPDIWYFVGDSGKFNGVTSCAATICGEEIYVSAPEFLAHMRGEDPALAAFDTMMGNAIDQLKGLTVRTLCDEVKENAVNDVM